MTKPTAEGTATLDKALDILDAIAAHPQGLTQADLSARLAVPRTTLYRLLATLGQRGLVRRDPRRRVYCLGFRCFELTRQAYAMPDLVAAASLEMRTLRDLTGETCYLAVLDGLEALLLDQVEGTHSHRSSGVLGARKPLHCTSQGKAILAAMAEADREAIVRQLNLPALTPHTLTDRRSLLAELRLTAVRGYSIDNEEIVPEVRCVGAPIIDGAGEVRGAISIAGPAYRLSLERVELLGPEVAEAARRIGARLTVTQVIEEKAGEVATAQGPWAFYGACPQWSPAEGLLYWADRLAPTVRVFDGRTDREWLRLETPIRALVLSRGQLLVAVESGCWIIDTRDRSRELIPWDNDPPDILCTDPEGEIWGCTVGQDGRTVIGPWSPRGGVGRRWTVADRVSALGWDPAGEQLYCTVPAEGSILMMRRDGSPIRRLATIPRGSGKLCGVAVDGQGGVWTALKEGWSVIRLAPDGNLDRVLTLPVSTPTDLAFGGADGGTLFVTSSRQKATLEALAQAPLSGRLLLARVDSAG